jgi:hypothetical protein
MTRRKIPYLKNSFKTSLAAVKEWKLFDDAQGCTLLDTHGLSLTMAKNPPPLFTETSAAKPPYKSAPTAAGKAAPKKEEEPPLLVAAWREMQGWGSKKSADGTPQVEPFDLYDLPIGMHADGFPVSEAFAKRWLNGRAYTAYVKDPKTGEMVEGRYDKDMIDTDTVKLNWLMGYERIKAKYDDLLSRVDNTKAVGEMRKKFAAFIATNPSFRGPLDTLQFCNGDLQDMHTAFQFQLAHVDTLDGLIEAKWSHLGDYLKNFGMSDVTASLASFYFYATVAKANLKQETYSKYNTLTGTQYCRRTQVEVTHIYAYVKDSYSFNDVGPSSQYLGHWNKTGVVIVPSAAAVSLSASSQKQVALEAGNETTPPFPVDLLGKLFGKDIYYPVRNRDFLNWRDKKGRGGDFLVFSNRELIKLKSPITLDMGEVCN